MERGVLAIVCALVIGVYAYAARAGFLASPNQDAADACYNQLVEGFRAGHLYLSKEAPPGLTQLSDPYNPTANAPYLSALYGLYDLSYYKGKLYVYFGITPALILYWPVAVLTGEHLYDGQAVAIFCGIGFLASVAVLLALWRRCCSGVSLWVIVAGVLALGLATGVPMLLPRSEVNEVAISCGYMLTMLALVAIWRALHESERKWRWVAAASLAYGLAVGARPTLLFGAVILLVPLVHAWRERRPVRALLIAGIVPITLIGLGLMHYNSLRFDNPLEFGLRYQLLRDRQATQQFFSLRYLWFNFRVYFLEPARWSRYFPFVREIVVPPLPSGHGWVEHPFGVLTNTPIVWSALAVPLAWLGRPVESRTRLCWFITSVALLLGICILIADLYYFTAVRFEAEFLPALVLLALVGILELERALATPGAWLADRLAWRCPVRGLWGLLLGFSVVFNLLATVERCADVHDAVGSGLEEAGDVPAAMEQFEQAVRINPNSAKAHNYLALTLENQGRWSEAAAQFEQAVGVDPDFVEARNNLAIALEGLGRMPEAIEQFKQALRIKPQSAEVHYNLGNAFIQQGNVKDAMQHYEEALRIRPDLTAARDALAHLPAGQ
jgi:tetratricopeptide (TPR) repeat protein